MSDRAPGTLQNAHQIDVPPSTVMTDPVAKDASSEASQSIARAISSGRPMRFIGALASRAWRNLAGSSAFANMASKYGELMVPGATALTRMFWPT